MREPWLANEAADEVPTLSEPEAPGKMGRPQKAINAEQVEKLAAMFCTVDEIAGFFECSRDTIHARFSDALQKGRDVGKVSIRRMQFRSAQRGNATMQIWLGKQYLDQNDRAKTMPEQFCPHCHLDIHKESEYLIDPNSPMGIMMELANQPIPKRPPKPDGHR